MGAMFAILALQYVYLCLLYYLVKRRRLINVQKCIQRPRAADLFKLHYEKLHEHDSRSRGGCRRAGRRISGFRMRICCSAALGSKKWATTSACYIEYERQPNASLTNQ